jgi:hypothetical protein
MRLGTRPLSIALIFLASVGASTVMAQTATAPLANSPPSSAPAASPAAPAPGAPPATTAPAPVGAAPAPSPYPYPPPGTYYYPYPQPGYYYPQPGYYPPSYSGAGYQPAGSPPPYAQPSYVPVAAIRPKPQHIHNGLYLRMNAGYDIRTSVSGRVGGLDTEYLGSGLGLSFSGGYAVVRNLILFGTLTLDTTVDTSEKLDGFSTYSNVDLNLYGFGAGVAYYIEFVNIYVAAAAMGMKADVSPTDSSGQPMTLSRLGPGFELLVGKEWWISENWGVGAAFQILQAWMPSADDPSQTMHGASWSLLFSATYN